MSAAEFDALESTLRDRGAAAALEQLAERFRAEGKLHELFDVRLMQARQRLGLPVGEGQSLEELPEPLRTQAGEAYRQACREVGELMLAEGRIREAWMYLRPAGGTERLHAALVALEPTDENREALIEVALHEGVNVPQGFRWLLDHHGTCNAITAFESIVRRCPPREQHDAAAQLVRHLHAELLANVRADIAREEKKEPTGDTLATLIEGRDWLFSGAAYHTDTTHLAAVVRIARPIEDAAVLRLALDLARYGERLDPRYQFAGEEPFVEMYPTHRLFFQALVGQQIEPALSHFSQRAEALLSTEEGIQPAEVYVYLLSRLGRYREAIRAAAQLISPEIRTSGLAPSLWELSRAAGDFGPLMKLCRERGDVAGFTAALVESRSAPHPALSAKGRGT